MNIDNQNIKSLNIGFNYKQLSTILSLYFYTLGSALLGFSLFLLQNSQENNITSWVGEYLFWFFVVFFSSIFILFLPLEFFNNHYLFNSSFRDLVSNIIYVIFISSVFLLFFQVSIEAVNPVLTEIKAITRASSLAGFIVMPIILYLLNSLSRRFNLLESYIFQILLLSWILSIQVFL